MADFFPKILGKFHKCLWGVDFTLGRRKRVRRGPGTLGNNPGVVGGTWHRYCHFVYYFTRSTLKTIRSARKHIGLLSWFIKRQWLITLVKNDKQEIRQNSKKKAITVINVTAKIS